MSALLMTIFYLTGALAGKTLRLGKYIFLDGKMEYHGNEVETALVARTLERNWQAYPAGHPALTIKPEEGNDNGQRDLSQDSVPNGGPAVSGGVQSNGEGAATGDAGSGDGSGDAGTETGKAAELAGGDGQPPSVSEADAAQLEALAAEQAARDAEEAAAAAALAEASKNQTAKPDAQVEYNQKLKKAIAQLDVKNDDHWTDAGLPAMKAVETFYGSAGITRADVNAAAPNLTRASLQAAGDKK